MTEFTMRLAPTSVAVEVEGHDISHAVAEVHIHKDGPHAVPTVGLVLYGEHVALSGEAVFEELGNAGAVADLIRSLDPETIEKQALERDPGMGQSIVPAMLDVIAEMISGRPA